MTNGTFRPRVGAYQRTGMTIPLSFMLLILCCSLPVTASNFVLEKDIAEQLAKSNAAGSQEWLSAGNNKFLGLYLNANVPKALGGIILLHGMAANPDWGAVISPLRTRLTDYGWTTLSIQMPILGNNATPEDYVPLMTQVPERITSAIEFFHSRGIYNIVIIGHGLGATMGAGFLASPTQSASVIKGFIGIGLGLHSQIKEFRTAQYIARIRIPVLDLFGSQDLESVQTSAQTRLLAARRIGNKAFRQTSILGSDHFFTGLNDLLINRVKSWLSKYAPSVKLDSNDVSKSDSIKNRNKK